MTWRIDKENAVALIMTNSRKGFAELNKTHQTGNQLPGLGLDADGRRSTVGRTKF